MLFNKSKTTNEKEFIEFRDGKVVPIHVDQPKKPPGVIASEEIPIYQEEPNLEKLPSKKIDWKGYVRKWFPKTRIKWIAIIAIAIFFALTIKDVYVSFFTGKLEQSNTEQIEKKRLIPTHVPDNKSNSNTLSASHEEKSNEVILKSAQSEASSNAGSLTDTLAYADEANKFIVTTAGEEINMANSYIDRKANKVAFQNSLEKSLMNKKEKLSNLESLKGVGVSQSMEDLFGKTEERLNRSVQFTEDLMQNLYLSQGREALQQLINQYIKQDADITQKQKNLLVKALKSEHIEYQISGENSSILINKS